MLQSVCSELYEPGNKIKSQPNAPHIVHGQPVPDGDMSAQQRKDSWRGKPASANLAPGQMLPDTEVPTQVRKDSWRGKMLPQPPGMFQNAGFKQNGISETH